MSRNSLSAASHCWAIPARAGDVSFFSLLRAAFVASPSPDAE